MSPRLQHFVHMTERLVPQSLRLQPEDSGLSQHAVTAVTAGTGL